ncbi:MAG: hypothetical protein NTY47_04210 [Candidatus Omnitrophica bacterium]|nr:hypothetical protein [Candidatus Omnitrophota bacterium]
MKIKVLTAKEKIFEEQASEVVLPGEDGEFSVQDFHQPCIYRLRQGRLRIVLGKDKKDEFLAIKKGVAHIGPLSMVVIAQI